MNLDLEEQKRIIQGQLEHFPSVPEKLAYLKEFFRPDPDFSDEACDWVIGELSKALRTTEHRCQQPDCGKTFEVLHPSSEPELDDAVRVIQKCDQLEWQAIAMPGTIATFCPDHKQQLERPNR